MEMRRGSFRALPLLSATFSPLSSAKRHLSLQAGRKTLSFLSLHKTQKRKGHLSSHFWGRGEATYPESIKELSFHTDISLPQTGSDVHHWINLVTRAFLFSSYWPRLDHMPINKLIPMAKGLLCTDWLNSGFKSHSLWSGEGDFLKPTSGASVIFPLEFLDCVPYQ